MNEYKVRRDNVIKQMNPNSIALLPGNKLIIRNNDSEYPFRQCSDFYYLTGFCEPDAVMVLLKDNEGRSKFILFNNERDLKVEQWVGKRAGQVGAVKEFGADESFKPCEFNSKLLELLQERETIYFPLGVNKEFNDILNSTLKDIKNKVRSGIKVPSQVIDILPIVHELRVIKSENEIDLLRKAAQISARAHVNLMKNVKTGMNEYQLEADFIHDTFNEGCRAQAYTPIVGSGENSCVLHYIDNCDKMLDGQLVLVDAGGEYNYYAADITRTFPVNGKFTKNQADIYDLVLNAQLAGIMQVKPGNTWDKIQAAILEVLIPGLIDLGLLSGSYEENLENNNYHKFYMHKSGHFLGLDVHDVGSYKIDGHWRKLEEGMVLTIEPGIYISENLEEVDKSYHGIGVRIEDDILVTKNGCEILSKDVPKERQEIERLMSA